MCVLDASSNDDAPEFIAADQKLALMEPGPAATRPNRMLTDTDAVRALGSASAQGADLEAIGRGTLSSLPVAASSTLGPIGTRFLSALAAAAEHESRVAAGLSERAAAASSQPMPRRPPMTTPTTTSAP
jgi:hypothetical protein